MSFAFEIRALQTYVRTYGHRLNDFIASLTSYMDFTDN